MVDDVTAAFPKAYYPTELSDAPAYRPGMTLRDWFAGQALAGLLANPDEQAKYGHPARDAYQIADSMLAVRGEE
jgi:hypothetical protein